MAVQSCVRPDVQPAAPVRPMDPAMGRALPSSESGLVPRCSREGQPLLFGAGDFIFPKCPSWRGTQSRPGLALEVHFC